MYAFVYFYHLIILFIFIKSIRLTITMLCKQCLQLLFITFDKENLITLFIKSPQFINEYKNWLHQ